MDGMERQTYTMAEGVTRVEGSDSGFVAEDEIRRERKVGTHKGSSNEPPSHKGEAKTKLHWNLGLTCSRTPAFSAVPDHCQSKAAHVPPQEQSGLGLAQWSL